MKFAPAMAAGAWHNLALKGDGSIVPWGRDDFNQTNVPSDIISNAIAISASGNMSLALLNNGSVRQWGETNLAVPSAVTGVTAIATGTNFNLALLSNGTVVPWGINNFGQTNVPTGLANVVAIAAGAHHALALKSNGTVVSWGDNTYGQATVPSILTNPAKANVISIAAGEAHSMALINDGTVIAWGDNTYGQTNTITNLTGVKAIAAGAYHSIALEFSPRVQYYPLSAAKDLLLIYNTNSTDSITVLNYYLAHRPMVSSANVLAINYTHSANYENITPSDFTNVILAPVTNWLAMNPTKRPQYVVLFLDIPSRVDTNTSFETYSSYLPSLSYQLANAVMGWNAFVTHINMGATNTVNHTNDCIHYINKLATFGSNYSSGQLVISAGRGTYGNTNYYFDDGNNLDPLTPGLDGMNGVIQNGASTNSITYSNNDTNGLLGHITNGLNVTGYLCWGWHSALRTSHLINASRV